MAITKTAVGLYVSDGTNLNQITASADLTSGLWDAANTFYATSLAATVRLDPKQTYYVAMLVNATTPGTHGGHVKTTNQPAWVDTYGPVPMYTKASVTSLPTSTAISGLTKAYDLIPWVGLA